MPRLIYINLLQIINILSLIGAFICAVYGGSIIPQNISNSSQGYIGDINEYNQQLKETQLNSYGFKLLTIGLSICAGNILILALTSYYIRCQEYYKTSPVIREVLSIKRNVRINPTVVEIPHNSVSDTDRLKNIAKWTGGLVIQEDNI